MELPESHLLDRLRPRHGRILPLEREEVCSLPSNAFGSVYDKGQHRMYAGQLLSRFRKSDHTPNQSINPVLADGFLVGLHCRRILPPTLFPGSQGCIASRIRPLHPPPDNN